MTIDEMIKTFFRGWKYENTETETWLFDPRPAAEKRAQYRGPREIYFDWEELARETKRWGIESDYIAADHTALRLAVESGEKHDLNGKQIAALYEYTAQKIHQNNKKNS